jgi:hypothetical protein
MRMRIATTVVCFALLASACGGAGGASAPAPATPAASSKPAKTADTNFDFGQQVTITADGFRPLWLVSIIHQPVVWTNDTDTPQSIVFDHLPVRSGVIPPGGTYTYTPDTVASITYHSGRRPTLEGKLQASWSSSDEAGASSGG